MTIRTWNDAFRELWLHAAKHRDVATSLGDMPSPTGSSRLEAWPRTRGSDVLAIAAVVDPILRALPAHPSGHWIEQRWRTCASDLAYVALEQPAREYAENRTFWSALGETTAYLATFDVPVPAELWRALFAELSSPGPGKHRNSATAAIDPRTTTPLHKRRNAAGDTHEVTKKPVHEVTKKPVEALPGRIVSVADAVGHAVGARLFSSFGIPLLVGGGVLLGMFLLLRNCDPREAE
jgi:hypothetical protein